MSRVLDEFNQLYQASHQVIRMSEVLDDKITDFLTTGYPRTKDDLLALRFASMPSCEDALKLSAELLPLDSFAGYEGVRDLSIELIARMVVVLRTFEDIQKMFSMYGHETDILQFNQLKATLASGIRNLRYTLSELRTLHYGKSWKLFEPITSLIPEVENAGQIGWWVFNKEPKEPGKPTPAPYVHYEELPFRVLDSVYEFVKGHPRYNLPDNYMYVLQENAITWSDPGMKGANADELDDECILALIIGVTCAERFSDGTIKRFFHDGTILRWLERLDALDYDSLYDGSIDQRDSAIAQEAHVEHVQTGKKSRPISELWDELEP